MRSIWKKNVEEEALLESQLTGIMEQGHGQLEGDEKFAKWLNELRDHAIEVNEVGEAAGHKAVGGNPCVNLGHGLTALAASDPSEAQLTTCEPPRGRQGPDHDSAALLVQRASHR